MFLTAPDGRRYVATDGPSYQLLTRTETLPFNLLVLLVFAVPALTALSVPMVGLLRRLTHRPTTTSTEWRLARGLAAGSALLGIVFLVALIAILIGDTGEFLYGAPVSFSVLLAVPILTLAAAAGAIAFTVRGWRRSGAGIAARIHQVTLLTAMVGTDLVPLAVEPPRLAVRLTLSACAVVDQGDLAQFAGLLVRERPLRSSAGRPRTGAARPRRSRGDHQVQPVEQVRREQRLDDAGAAVDEDVALAGGPELGDDFRRGGVHDAGALPRRLDQARRQDHLLRVHQPLRVAAITRIGILVVGDRRPVPEEPLGIAPAEKRRRRASPRSG